MSSTVPDDQTIRQATFDLALKLVQQADHTLLSENIHSPLTLTEENEVALALMDTLRPYVELAQTTRDMRHNQLAFWGSPKGSPEKQVALTNSKQLEKRCDGLLSQVYLPPVEEKQEAMAL